jgi:capsular exopolysaccharide synthesis family protein
VGYGPPWPGSRHDEIDPKKILGLVMAHRWLIVGVTVGATLVGILYAFLATPIYFSQATVFVERGQPTMGRDLAAGNSDYSVYEETYFTSQLGIMRSREVQNEAFTKLGPTVQGGVNVTRRKDSSLFDIAGISTDPKSAAAIANGVADAYNTMTIRQNSAFLAETNQLVITQAQKIQEEYAKMQKEYGTLLTQTGTYYPKNQRQIIDNRIGSLESRKSEILIEKQRVESQLIELRQIEKGFRDPLSVASVRDDDTVKQLAIRYEEGKKDLARMADQFTPDYPPYKKKAMELESITSRIRTQAQMLLRAQEGKHSALSTELGSMERELAELKGQAIETSGGSSQMEAMGSGVEALQRYMTLLNDKMREMDVTSKLLSSRVRIIDRAQVPKSPFKPQKARVILLSFLLGLALSGGILVGIQFLDTRIKDPDTVAEKVGAPMLGLIPIFEKERQSLVVEAFQTLRTSIYYASDHKRKRVVLITSSSSGEGKSACTTNLANVLAKAGDRVLVVDADLRKSSMHKFLKVEATRGLSEFMADLEAKAEDFIAETPIPGLWLMPAGKTPHNPPALFSVGKFKEFLDQARADYDWVLIDSPPCIAVTDALLIAEHVDLILMVAAMNQTQMPLLERAMDLFSQPDHNLAGLVLNRFDWTAPYYYSYYYRNYYARHYHYYQGQALDPSFAEKAWMTVQSWFKRSKHRRR